MLTDLQQLTLKVPAQQSMCMKWRDEMPDSIVIEEGARLKAVIVIEKAHDQPRSLTITLAGHRARIDCVIMILADGFQVPMNVRVIHAASHTQSRLAIRSAARNSAKVNVEGLLSFESTAHESIARFSHHALH